MTALLHQMIIAEAMPEPVPEIITTVGQERTPAMQVLLVVTREQGLGAIQ